MPSSVRGTSRKDLGGRSLPPPRSFPLAELALRMTFGAGEGFYTRTLPGPAAFTASLTPDSYFLKFSANMSARWVALAS